MRTAPFAPDSEPSRSRALALWQVQGSSWTPRQDAVATEEPLEIRVGYERRGQRLNRSLAVTMRTPGDDDALAAGFLLTEGIVGAAADIRSVGAEPGENGAQNAANRIRVELADGVELDWSSLERNFYTTSSCGICGKASLEALRARTRFPLMKSGTPAWPVAALGEMPARLRAAQAVFERTGGLHAAGLFDASGALVEIREDVGRHNAVDKLIGAQLLAGRMPLAGCLLQVSGRASFELMQKALMAGIPTLAAVGAPSSLAVDLARESGATLIGFMRDGRFNVYSGPERVGGGVPVPFSSSLSASLL